jgi:aminoglycoside 3'-phosphotransferase I
MMVFMTKMPREILIEPIETPPSFQALVCGYHWSRDTVGESGAVIYRLHHADKPSLYLKHGLGAAAADVFDEAARLRWLLGRISVPQVCHFEACGDDAWLAMTSTPGHTAYQVLESHPEKMLETVKLLARFLKNLHALPLSECPFHSDVQSRLALAHQRMTAGLVDTDDFDDAHEGWTAEQVWAKMMDLVPLNNDEVVTHGDYSLDNIIIEHGCVTGCIDVGRVGRADRYQDIAILWNNLSEFGDAAQAQFIREYGIDILDERKIEFYLALDEFF